MSKQPKAAEPGAEIKEPRPKMAAPARSLHNALSDEAMACHALQRLLASGASAIEINEAANELARAADYRQALLTMFWDAQSSTPKE